MWAVWYNLGFRNDEDFGFGVIRFIYKGGKSGGE